ncbi:MAG: ribonuclease H-like domain-containing protein [Tepidibacter sp.]|jgi:DNA polymerase elongation subunit (family B)|uniref:ribonuclease H-like domain-containing protein n=1 Tax=Tepidibacter sp. TaxID=2529387 RepID=UPI0025FABF98|nr:ribonuclease H-like domain-containing protein [Tepidibacter sp.]MCT4509164.1 ribonuclease H-like domain-containing protein [Tepidibacter sp.]
MEVITHKIDEIIDIPRNSCVFDIETTGLSPKYNKVILIGILYIKDNQTIIKQFFAHTTDNEKELLFYFKEVFKTFDKHITFNGHRFDIPFLNKRFEKNNLDFFIDKDKDMDILKIVKPYQKELNLENCKLKTVEGLLNIQREDTISGKESVDMYKEFESTKNESLRKKILLHNYEDIYYLAKLFKVQDIIDSTQTYINIDYLNTNLKLRLSKYKFKGNYVYIEYLSKDIIPINIQIYEDDYSIIGSNQTITVELNLSFATTQNNNKVIYFKQDKIIPLKIDSDILEENILNAASYLFKNTF